MDVPRGTILTDAFEKAGLQPDEKAAARFLLYNDLLIETNRSLNLTAITEFDEVVVKHFLDSCMPLADRAGLFMGRDAAETSGERPAGLSLVDVGTGAGFPGLPLKIMLPEIRLTLIDSLRKRVDFLKETVSALSLDGTECIHARAEEAGRDLALREQFDIAVSRAVARLSILSEYVLPFVKEQGVFIAYKSGEVEEELRDAENALRILGGSVEKVSTFTLPGTDIQRSLIYIRKTSKTPEKYPRRAGKPEKSPL